MLNESKVKLMTRMAMYESKQGEEDFKISSYYKKDYRSFHTIATIIWVTVGYAVAVGIGVIAFLDELKIFLEKCDFNLDTDFVLIRKNKRADCQGIF